MIQDYIDMDTQEKIRYVSESSNASTSGYSTMSPTGVQIGCSTVGGGNISPASAFSMPPSPAESPATALQTEFSKLDLPSNTPQQHQQYVTLQSTPFVYMDNNYMNFTNNMQAMSSANAGGSIVNSQRDSSISHKMLQNVTTAPKSGLNVKKEYSAKLRILEQPVEKFRFRYKSEMHGTHGSLTGVNSKRTPKTFPEVELCNFSGHAVIRCSIFQTNIDSPHSHQLVIRKDDADICDPHDLHVSPERGTIAQFQNMGIIHTAKKFIFEELLKKKMDRFNFEFGRDDLSAKKLQELHKETEKEAKDMNLNQVRLCFEAFKVEDNNTWIRIAAPVYSNPINNRKSAQTGELRICRLSIATGSVTGGDDLILLVEKVSKKNIKVRFYEVNEDDETVWEAFGKFRESDVHHQYAIVCQTPPYKDKDIDKPIEVYIELVRPSDDERSCPPVTFRYKPRDSVASRKRRRTCSTASLNSASSSMSSFELPKSVQEQSVNIQMGTQSNAQPSYSVHMMQHLINDGMTLNAPTISEEFNKDQELQKLIGSETFRDFINSNSEELSKLCPQNISDLYSFDDLQTTLCQTDGRLEADGTPSLSSSRLDRKQTVEYKKIILQKALTSIVVNGNKYLQRIVNIFEDARTRKDLNTGKFEALAEQVESIYIEHAEKNEHCDTIMHEAIANDNPKLCIKICQILSFFKLADLFNRTLNTHGESVLHYACIYDRAHYIRPLLRLGCDLNIQDRHGNTAVHIAVKEDHQKCIESFFNVEGIRFNASIRNDEGLSPLHLAIRHNLYDIAAKLLKYDKSTAIISNTKDGNNALQMAVQQQNMPLVQLILDGHHDVDVLNTRNAAGYTAIELAKNMGTSMGNKIFSYLTTLKKENPMTIKEEVRASSNSLPEEGIENEAPESIEIKRELSDQEDEPDESKLHELECYDNDMNIKDDDSDAEETKSIHMQHLETILNDDCKFPNLVKLLNDPEKWKDLAQKSQMHYLICLWTNAEDMLNYVKTKANSIEYRLFACELAKMHKNVLQVLQAK